MILTLSCGPSVDAGSRQQRDVFAASFAPRALRPMQHLAGQRVHDLALGREVVGLVGAEPARAAGMAEQGLSNALIDGCPDQDKGKEVLRSLARFVFALERATPCLTLSA
jgi:hypothetical protein